MKASVLVKSLVKHHIYSTDGAQYLHVATFVNIGASTYIDWSICVFGVFMLLNNRKHQNKLLTASIGTRTDACKLEEVVQVAGCSTGQVQGAARASLCKLRKFISKP